MQRSWILLVFLASGAVAALAQSSDKCGDLAKFQMPGAKIEITRAELVAAGPAAGGRAGQAGPLLPAHCRVNGIMDRRTGPDGKNYGIRFAIALPANWTGQFLQQGGGGLNGTVAEPSGHRLPETGLHWREGSRSPPAIPVIKAPAARSTGASCRTNKPRSISSLSGSGG